VRYRLLVVDVDGTLVGASGEVEPRVADALARARDAGIQIALSTGRTPPACAAFIEALGLAGPHIFFDGGLVMDPADPRPVLERRVDAAATAELLAFVQAWDISAEVYTRDGYYTSRLTPEIEAHAALQRCRPVEADIDALLGSGEVVKAELVLASPAQVAAVRAHEPAVAGRLRLSWATAPALPHLTFVNVVDPGVSKGNAVATLARHLAVPPSAVVAVGDSANDLPMFAVAGLAVAMGNAPGPVQAAAHLVAGRVDEGGLADLIERHLLPAAPGAPIAAS
jgi:Cof subfamily protein (haloacid dehalogenase superfamily)